MKNDAVRYLIGQYMNDQLTEEQQSALLQLLGQPNETELIALLREMMEGESVNAAAVDPDTLQASLQRVLAADKAIQPAMAGRVVSMHRRWQWVAAAVCILAVGVTGYVLLNKKTEVPAATATIAYKNDVQPGGDKAILTLANGQQLVLDSAVNGVLAQQGSAQVMKDGSSLKYQRADGKGQAAVAFNTLATPNGGQYKLILPDGSEVWLNAASSIRYPTAFSDSERKVEITGEVYFEITKNQHKPFRVQLPANAGMIEVLGTHFNVNTYNDEEAIRTTLLEGKVRVASGEWPVASGKSFDQEIMLKPGEQAVFTPHSPLAIDHSPDLEQVMAWTNGQFVFRDQRIDNIMKQLSRWYDVEISYSGKPVQEGFNATIPRNVPVSKVLRLLELTTLVHFKIEGKKITVLP
jgi:transmembrane sensor